MMREGRHRPATGRTAGALVGALALVAACSGEGATSPAASTAPPTLAVGSLAEPSPTTATARPVEADGGPTFEPAGLVARSSTRPWLLVGTGRDRPGAPQRAVAYASVDGTSWSLLPLDAPDHSTAEAAVATADGAAIVAGTIDGDGGVRPALWSVDADGAGAPVEVDVAGRPRAVTAISSGAAVLLVDGPDGPAVVTPAGGGWTTTPLPGAADAAGIAASGSTVVVTGPTTQRSTDGGRTFAPVPAPPLGAVAATPAGFVAASCATGGVTISPDGGTWTELPAAHPRGVVPAAGVCGTIGVDPDGGAWLAASVGGQPAVFRVRDGAVDLLGIVPRPPATIFDGLGLVAASDGTVVAAVPQPGGVAVGQASVVTLTTGLELDAAMTPATGLPSGRPGPVAVVPLDDRGQVGGILTYPVVTDNEDGSYRWTTTIAAGRFDDAGRLVIDPAAAPSGPDGDLGGIVATEAGATALATVAEPDLPAGAPVVGDVVASTRASGSWSARRVVVGGPGRQAVAAVAAAGERVVGVGEERLVDPATGAVHVRPLVLAGEGTTFERIAVDSASAISLTAACVHPGGTILALGTDTSTGAGAAVRIDPAALTATVERAPTAAPPIGCAPVGEDVLVAAPDALAAVATDGAATPLAVLRPGERVTAIGGGPAGVAVAGTTATGDGFVLAGASAGALARLDAPGLAAAGEHEPTGLVVRDDHVLVLGLDDGEPATWRIGIG